jgi:putative flippase GtrA
MSAMKPVPAVPTRLLTQFSRFAAVGAIGTAMHYLVLIALVSAFGCSPVLSTTFGALVGALANYWLNRRFTFASDARHRQALPRFLLMAACGLLLNATIVGILTSLELHYLAAQIVATAVVLVTNYIMSKTWVFRTPKS